MSHYVCLVILPRDTAVEEVEERVGRMLAPYDESLEVRSYQERCWCVGLEARKEVERILERRYPVDRLRARFAELPEQERTQQHWQEMIAPRAEAQKRMMAGHPRREKASDACAECEGTGVRTSTSNPNGKWDWWVIGGRWDGWIHGPEREAASRDADGGFNFGSEHHTAANNACLVKDIPIDGMEYPPFAIVTPDGQWHEAGSMSWWGIVTDAVSPGEWRNQVKELLAQYQEHLAAAVDCHT